MKVNVLEIEYNSNGKELSRKKIKNCDSEILMLENRTGAAQAWRVLGFVFNYSCGQTKKGYRINRTSQRCLKSGALTVNHIFY